MNITLIISISAIVLGLYMAWNIGANDIANSMGSAVGAEAITLKQAIFIGSVLCIVGAILVGGHVTETIKKGIIHTQKIQDLNTLTKGLLATLLSAGLWVTFSTWRGWPVSTTHSIVGSLLGFGIFIGGSQIIAWQKIIGIVISWISSPLFAGLLGFGLFKLIRRYILMVEDSEKRSLKFAPICVGLTFLIVSLSILLKTPVGALLKLTVFNSILLALLISMVSSFFGFFLISASIKKGADVESIFRILQIITSCYVAFSIGTNDVANAIGPVAGIFSIIENNNLSTSLTVPIYLLALGGFGIMVGITTWGYRVISTIGKKITELTNTRGFSIDFSAATSVLLASKLGMPVSTTHAVIGAVCGVGLARGLEAVDFRIVKTIFISWIITLPAAGFTCILFFKAFDLLF